MKDLRREEIKKLLLVQPFVSYKELEEHFPDVTGMTLRRDIEFLETQGELIRVRNGARSMKFITSSVEDGYDLRKAENAHAKAAIARSASELAEAGQSIFMDAGSTMIHLARYMPDKRITITTPGPNIAIELTKKKTPIINLVGGMVNHDSICVSGTGALSFMKNINIDVAFMASSGYSLDRGFSCGNFSESELKNYIISKAALVVMLMDSSKFDKNLTYTFCYPENVDILITDKPLPEKFIESEAFKDVEVVVAGESVFNSFATRCLPKEE